MFCSELKVSVHPSEGPEGVEEAGEPGRQGDDDGAG